MDEQKMTWIDQGVPVPPGRKKYLYPSDRDLVAGDPDHISRLAGGELRLRIEIKGDLP